MDPIELLFVILISVVFVFMAGQGGLLDMLADGWWHLAYVEQIIANNSLFIDRHPIVGVLTDPIIYPPLWHLQLALICQAAGIAPPVLWHFMAAFNVILLLSAFYALSLELTARRKVALLAVIFHIFLVGGLSSYFRVGSWPGNFSYIALYYALALTFRLSSQLGVNDMLAVGGLGKNKAALNTLGLLVCAIIAMGGLHGVEVPLYFFAIFSYLISTYFFYRVRKEPVFIQADRFVIRSFLYVGLIIGVLLAVTILRNRYIFLFGSPPAYAPYLSLFIPMMVLGYLAGFRPLLMGFGKKWGRQKFILIYVLGLGGMLWFCIDFPHLRELFIPNPDLGGAHVPRDFLDDYGNWVFLPFWKHQLRGAMLFSGISSLAIGLTLVFFRRNRATVFIFATSSLVFLVLFSPYFFTLTAFVIPLASVYRVSLLLFSPLIFAILFSELWCREKST